MTIVCGTDFSEASRGALSAARALAALRGDRDIVLAAVVENDRDATFAQTTFLEAIATAGPGVAIRSRIAVGDVGDALAEIATSEASDFVVIAAGSSPPRFGSAAERIVTSARVPVLVIRDPAPWLAFAGATRPLRLLVSLDDSLPSELSIQWTHALRTRGPVDVVLGAVYYPDESAEGYGLPAKPLVERDPEVEALIARDLMKRFGTADRVVARTKRGLGRIGDHVLELATEESVDAIIIGTSQKTGLGRLGSVSTVVVREGRQSVLCVPPNAKVPTLVVPTPTSVLVATDLSPPANRAVSVAFGAIPHGGEVHIVHVVERGAQIDEAQKLRHLKALAPTSPSHRLTAHVVRSDDTAIAIAQTAARLGCDLICLAVQKRSAITRAVMGSVADRVLQVSTKPILILGPR